MQEKVYAKPKRAVILKPLPAGRQGRAEESRQALKLWSDREHNLKVRSRTRRVRRFRSFVLNFLNNAFRRNECVMFSSNNFGKTYAPPRMTLVAMASLILMCVSVVLFPSNTYAAGQSLRLPFSEGETIIYDIQKFKLTIGEATLVFNGLVEVGGQKALSITFTAKGFNFLDEESIYLDPETFFPLVIKRDLNIFGKKEKIVEFYDPHKGRVRIVKTVKGKVSERIIESGKRFDNIYGFIYRYRQLGQFQEDEEFQLHLPTRDVIFTFMEKKKVQAAGQEFVAYFMSSMPKKYKVGFDSGPKKIPLMIDGVLGLGSASMIMKKYDSGG